MPSGRAMKLKAFKHQEVSLKHDEKNPVVFDCSDPGTGKTFVRIMAYAKRRRQKKAGKLLVVAGKSQLRSVWAEDFKKFAPDMKVLVSKAGSHDKVFAQDADVYVINHDAIKWAGKKNKKFFMGFTDLVIDESTAFKRPQSDRGRVAGKVAQWFSRRACLTGTPHSITILDIWNQAYILDGGKRLGNLYYRFRNEVCTPVQVGRSEKAIQWQDKDGAEEAVFSLLSDIVVRHRLEDCTDIPPNHTYPRSYDLTPQQVKAYLEMERTMIMEVYGHPNALRDAAVTGKMPQPVRHLTAVHAASKMQKLLQIASGAVYGDDGNYHVIDTGRYEFVVDLIEERKHSVCFYLWKHQRDLIIAELERRGMTFAVIDGSMSDSERADIVRRYQNGEYRTVLGHPKSIAHGLTFTRGTATIWPSPTADYEFFKQGARRVYRLTQKQKTENIVVLATGTLEEYLVWPRLEARANSATKLLEMFAMHTDELE